MRTVANGGLAVSYGVSLLAGGENLVPLLLLDAATSLAAFVLGLFVLPAARSSTAGPGSGEGASYPVFLAMTAIVAGWSVGYECYLTASAALLRVALGPDGVRVFSGVMVLNTVGCTVLAVVLARAIAKPDRAVPAGFALLLLGAAIGVGADAPSAVLGMTVVTLGELLYSATAQYVWMGLVPAGKHRGAVFSAGMTATFLGRALGASLAFPLVVEGSHPHLAMAAIVAPFALLAASARPIWRAWHAIGAVR